MNEEFSLKELYDVTIKLTYPIDVDGHHFIEGETIAAFDKLAVANFKEITSFVTAHGGYGDKPHVFWETTKELHFRFSQGVFSKNQAALMTNAQILKAEPNEKPLYITKREELEVNEDNEIVLQKAPAKDVFIYNKETGGTFEGQFISSNKIKVFDCAPYTDVLVSYDYIYEDTASVLTLGRKFLTGFVTLQGKTRVKDDITGRVRTGIIQIPKLKILSDLSMQLGRTTSPVVGTFEGVASPVGTANASTVMEFWLLNNDVDSDM